MCEVMMSQLRQNSSKLAMIDRRKSFVALAAAVVGLAGLVGEVSAANRYWDTGVAAGLQAGDGTWDTATTALWSTAAGGTALTTWANDDAAFFQGTTPAYTATLSGTVNAYSVTNVNSNVTLSGGTLQVGAGGISSTGGGAAPMTINSAVTLNGSQSWIFKYNTSKVTVAGNISESVVGSILSVGLATGSGTTGGVLLLTGNNLYTGGTILNGATTPGLALQVGSNTALESPCGI